MEITGVLAIPVKLFHGPQAARHRHLRQGVFHALEISPAVGGAGIQHGDGTGVRFCADGPAKALLQLDLHLGHHHGPQEGMEIRVSLPLFFLQRVGHGEWQPGDDQQGHAVSRKVKALPGRPGGQQDAPRPALELLYGVHCIPSQGIDRVSGTAAADGAVDFTCNLQASALCGAQVFAEASDGEISVEGVLNAAVFMKNGEGEADCVRISLPFAFPVRSDRAKAGMRAAITAAVCGVSVRQKTEGELEAEGALMLFVVLFSSERGNYVSRIEPGEEEEKRAGAISVYMPAAGDSLWETAKKLGKTPEEVQGANPELSFPLTGGERIVVYRRKGE